MKRSVSLWIIAVVVTLLIVIYQRMTGPSYPIKGATQLANESIKFKLERTHGGKDSHRISIVVHHPAIQGKVVWKRYKYSEPWKTIAMQKSKNQLIAFLPWQPPAGKLQYFVLLSVNGKETSLSEKKPVVIRFKGAVPPYYLIPHIFFMFLAILFAIRTGMEVLFTKDDTQRLAWETAIFLFLGGLILGPIVQYYAFGSFWTGFPVGHDLTDTKTLAAMLVWCVAFWKSRNGKDARYWVLAAVISTLAVYLIPHSVLGSELDYNKVLKK